MRGKPDSLLNQMGFGRNIPAHAGKTVGGFVATASAGEHPRACGENCPATGKSASTAGTSPRMRGKQTAYSADEVKARNIPAHAGKTYRMAKEWILAGEHPRVCGENCGRWWSPTRWAGTSPRMRGKHADDPRQVDAMRNIPAYAGKTKFRVVHSFGVQEHPRVCGENGDAYGTSIWHRGTSPRMRGKRLVSIRSLIIRRNIPAYAGKTGHVFFVEISETEHPRVCGENRVSSKNFIRVSGTSPRMRGKLLLITRTQ